MIDDFGYIELKQAAEIWLDSSDATHGDFDMALHEAEVWWSIFREVETLQHDNVSFESAQQVVADAIRNEKTDE